MSQVGETFFSVVGCMDGRVQEPIAKFGQDRFGALYPDTITEAGIVGLLAKNPVDQHLLQAIKFKAADVSIGKHHSKGILAYGHQECAGNPVSDEQQKKRYPKVSRSYTIICSFGDAGNSTFCKNRKWHMGC